jgi:hypothetical protein
MASTKNDSGTSLSSFLWVGLGLFPALVIVNTLWIRFLITPRDSVFFAIAAAIVVSWILILAGYYSWAIYFYNINMGWTDQDWKDQEAKRQANPNEVEPESNPNNEETLGLPPGTVRGTIALSVLVGGLAMLIASLAMPGKYSQNEFLVDNFEYIKTAFLMVIAFYFGSKSLEMIDRKRVFGGGSANDESGVSSNAADGGVGGSNVPKSSAPVPTATPASGTIGEKSDFDDSSAKG